MERPRFSEHEAIRRIDHLYAPASAFLLKYLPPGLIAEVKEYTAYRAAQADISPDRQHAPGMFFLGAPYQVIFGRSFTGFSMRAQETYACRLVPADQPGDDWVTLDVRFMRDGNRFVLHEGKVTNKKEFLGGTHAVAAMRTVDLGKEEDGYTLHDHRYYRGPLPADTGTEGMERGMVHVKDLGETKRTYEIVRAPSLTLNRGMARGGSVTKLVYELPDYGRVEAWQYPSDEEIRKDPSFARYTDPALQNGLILGDRIIFKDGTKKVISRTSRDKAKITADILRVAGLGMHDLNSLAGLKEQTDTRIRNTFLSLETDAQKQRTIRQLLLVAQ